MGISCVEISLIVKMIREKQAGSIGLILAGLVCIIGGSLFTYYGTFPNFVKAKVSSEWPKTQGLIISSRAALELGTGNKAHLVYKPIIKYSYNVNGKKYQSTQVFIGNKNSKGSMNHSEANQFVALYPVGKKVDVFYSDSNITNAVLDPGLKFYHFGSLGLSVFFILIGFFVLIVPGKRNK